MKLPQVVEIKGKRVLTSAQIAECYDTTLDRIKQNFRENKGRYIEGKHYISLTGAKLRDFKNEVGNSYPDSEEEKNEVRNSHPEGDKARRQFDTQFKYAKSLYLWTEKGALLHAKSLNTDKAWEVYDYLVDFYFRQQDVKKVEEKTGAKEIVPVNQSTRKVPDAIEKKEETPANNMFRGLRSAKGMRTDITKEEARDLMETMRKHLTGMDALMEVYSMYLSEEDFKKVGHTIELLGERISKFAWSLSVYEPKLVEKYL